MEHHDNSIEFLTEDEFAYCTFHRGKYKNRIKKLKEKYPDKVKIISDSDSCVHARLPADWVKISPPRQLNITEEKRKEMAERMRKIAEFGRGNKDG